MRVDFRWWLAREASNDFKPIPRTCRPVQPTTVILDRGVKVVREAVVLTMAHCKTAVTCVTCVVVCRTEVGPRSAPHFRISFLKAERPRPSLPLALETSHVNFISNTLTCQCQHHPDSIEKVLDSSRLRFRYDLGNKSCLRAMIRRFEESSRTGRSPAKDYDDEREH